MTSLTGTGSLARFILRRDRAIMPAWIAAFALLPMATASGFRSLYPTAEAMARAAGDVGGNPAFRAMFGPIYGNNLGALVAWRMSIAIVVMGVVSVLTVIRHTRVEEEMGRRELIGSTVVGRHAPLAASLVVIVGANVVVALGIALGLIAMDLSPSGAFAFGLTVAAAGVVFAGVGALAAQLTETSGGARAIGLSVVVLAYVLRAAGDAGGASGPSWLSLVSPIGWVQRIRAFAGERWWIISVALGVAGTVGGAALVLSARRDVGAGVLPPRLGPAAASSRLATPLGLAWRLHRGLLIGWSVALGVLGAIYGSVAEGVGDLLVDSPDLREIFERLGGSGKIIDAYLGGVMGVMALIAAAYGIQATLRLRVEEENLRAESVLAAAVNRSRWMGSHLVFAFGGPALALGVAGLVTGLTYGAIAGDVAGQVPRVLAAALVHLPAVWVMAALGAALFGLLPRLSALSWAVYTAAAVVGILGVVLQLSHWVVDASPFTHVPKLPGAPLTVIPLLWLLAIAAGLATSGVTGFGRRDLG